MQQKKIFCHVNLEIQKYLCMVLKKSLYEKQYFICMIMMVFIVDVKHKHVKWKAILSQNSALFNGQTKYYNLENIYIWFVFKFTLYNHLHKIHHLSFTDTIFKDSIESWRCTINWKEYISTLPKI